ncbi:MAG: hypothetical protein HY699_12105 [Deltaproteobacteria bacterium]|nr:hypothetical protein [Deltaproteobacteria bacterium]
MTVPAAAPALGDFGQAIERIDFVRRSPFALGGARHHKEWQHFVVLSAELDLLVNFSYCDDARPRALQGAEFPRLVLLLRERGWDGDVEQFAMAEATSRGGRIDLTFGGNRLRFHDGRFLIAVALRERPITVELALAPVTQPAYVPSIPMLDGPPLNWVVVPRLQVRGVVTVAGRRYQLDGAPAYHDHNWGHFLWGHDVSWEWGFVLPESETVPWCLTFVRLTDRARTRALAQQLLLWRGAHLLALFRECDLEAEAELVHLRPAQVFKVPRVMALVAPECSTDVPRSYEVRARARGDWLTCRCTGSDMAQVVIPSETRLGVTIFNEVSARASVQGCIDGERVEFCGRSILEFIRDY